MALKKVVLPAPLGPMMLTIFPRSIWTVILLTAVRPPKRFTTSLVVRMYLSSDTLDSFLFEVRIVRQRAQFALAARSRMPKIRRWYLAGSSWLERCFQCMPRKAASLWRSCDR